MELQYTIVAFQILHSQCQIFNLFIKKNLAFLPNNIIYAKCKRQLEYSDVKQ